MRKNFVLGAGAFVLVVAAAGCGEEADAVVDDATGDDTGASDATADQGGDDTSNVDADPGDTAQTDSENGDAADSTGDDTLADTQTDGSNDADSDTEGDTVALPEEPTEQEIVADEGGVIDHAGAELIIPGGALDANLVLTVDAAYAEVDGLDVVGAVYEFGPDGTEFNVPIRVSLPAGGSDAAASTIWWTNREGEFEPIATFVDGDNLYAYVDHFSSGVVVTCGSLVCTGAEPSCDGDSLVIEQPACSAGTCAIATTSVSCAVSLPNMDGTCAAGACVAGDCRVGFSDCDGNPTNGCERFGGCASCGNGITEGGEQCDDGNPDPGDGCNPDCTLPGGVCVAEICGDGLDNDCDGTVDNDCGGALCGNGITEAGEECDDGNAMPDDGCNPDCRSPGGACVPEVCGDGIDNDCDGTIDNVDFMFDVANCGGCGISCLAENAASACNAGTCTFVCLFGWDDGDGNPSNGCETRTCVPSAEICDGIDNDCNGVIDEGCGGIVCGNAIVEAGEECDDGNATPDDGCNPDCRSSGGACVPEICGDGIDNDCDGTIDNVDFMFDPGNCGGCGIVCAAANAASTCDAGACAFVCMPGWADGDGNPGNGCETRTCFPSPEVCDGIDNDCNGLIDEGCGGLHCGNAILEAGEECDDGNATPDDGCNPDCRISGGACVPEVCGDGIDNDCDGTIDNVDFMFDVANCGGCGNVCAAANAASTCNAGTCAFVCMSGWADGDGNPGNGCETRTCFPSAEVCDGIDNDCNGVIDEGCGSFECGNSITEPGEQCDDGNPTPGDGCEPDCTLSGGACVDGDGDGFGVGCAAGYDCDDFDGNTHAGAAEICGDARDNDCDGTIDDGCGGALEMCFNGMDDDGDGMIDCADSDCAAEPLCSCTPSPEVCDGIDNDCSGTIDDNLPNLPCSTGMPGACAAGVTFCFGGADVCVGPNPVPELCGNGIDDDCNGAVDELCAPSCTDSLRNGTESDVDCGGGVCAPCTTGKLCNIAPDCMTGICTAGVCN